MSSNSSHNTHRPSSGNFHGGILSVISADCPGSKAQQQTAIPSRSPVSLQRVIMHRRPCLWLERIPHTLRAIRQQLFTEKLPGPQDRARPSRSTTGRGSGNAQQKRDVKAPVKETGGKAKAERNHVLRLGIGQRCYGVRGEGASEKGRPHALEDTGPRRNGWGQREKPDHFRVWFSHENLDPSPEGQESISGEDQGCLASLQSETHCHQGQRNGRCKVRRRHRADRAALQGSSS